MPHAAAARVATDVECAMDDNTPYARKKDDYLAKARQLAFNLKKNEQLRCGIHPPQAVINQLPTIVNNLTHLGQIVGSHLIIHIFQGRYVLP